jgi:hypothetical protein
LELGKQILLKSKFNRTTFWGQIMGSIPILQGEPLFRGKTIERPATRVMKAIEAISDFLILLIPSELGFGLLFR